MSRRTKIVATLGPASDSAAGIEELIVAGVDVFRLNLSHGEVADHLERLARVRAVAARAGRVVAVLADLPGPKVRSGQVPDGGVFLEERTVIAVRESDGDCAPGLVTVDAPGALDGVEPGDRLVLGDGAITLLITERDEAGLVATVVTGGRIQGRPGVHVPSSRLSLRAPTDEDLVLAREMTAAGVDFLALSFVRSPIDVLTLRSAVGDTCPPIIAKIETADALTALDDLLTVADAVMVARGDLGIECPMEDVPHLQKRIVRASVTAGVPVITATQMLESMIESPTPTRAEVTDVANAVFDGTDAVMLSAETAIGHDPASVVRTMARIAQRAEADANYRQWGALQGRLQSDSAGRSDSQMISAAMTHAGWLAAQDAKVAAIVCCTRSGFTARQMARFRPTALLIGASPSPITVRRLALSWGVVPMAVDEYASTDELVWCAVEAAVRNELVRQGDTIAVLAGAPDVADAATDVLRLVRVR